MTTQASIIAEGIKKKAEGALVTILKSREVQRSGLNLDEVFYRLRKVIEPDIDINRAITEKHLEVLLAQGKILGTDGFFRWDHHRGLCHTFTNGVCKCCGEERLLNAGCPSCQIVNPI